MLDEEVLSIGGTEEIRAFEEGVHFLDPFTTRFMELWLSNSSDRDLSGNKFSDAGVPSIGKLPPIDGDIGLKVILDGLKARIRSPLPDKEWSKVAWLYDRIAKQLGVPPASSYPRVYPGSR